MKSRVETRFLVSNLRLEEVRATRIALIMSVPGAVRWIVPLHRECKIRILSIRPRILEGRELLNLTLEAELLVAGLDAGRALIHHSTACAWRLHDL